MPKVCILICTFNRPELLRQLLTALVPQARAHGCVTIIVDNGTQTSEAVVSFIRPEMEITNVDIRDWGIAV